MVLGILGRDLARVDQVLHEGVVGGYLREGVPAQHVGARVADVDHRQPVAAAHEGDARGAQPLQVYNRQYVDTQPVIYEIARLLFCF